VWPLALKVVGVGVSRHSEIKDSLCELIRKQLGLK